MKSKERQIEYRLLQIEYHNLASNYYRAKLELIDHSCFEAIVDFEVAEKLMKDFLYDMWLKGFSIKEGLIK